eukprot:Seg1430.4 transcript_id=Seg1430.4/GoldUCD/mRNA.D3Y31 product="hypothetical protein" protein_id=Seg1430.4/GoldUCD/D3Y31
MKRRLLIGSYYGKKIGLATPLLKWYLSKGMKITRIYRILEYKPAKAFNKFMNDVADARLMGDQQGSSLNAEIMKLIGNSAFGKTIVRKEKHRNVQFVNAQEVAMCVSNKLFYQWEKLNDGLWQVIMNKKKIVLDQMLAIGVFLLCYAKLRMLVFYYDFIDQIAKREDFEYCEMDTDSAYIAISGEKLDDIVHDKFKYETIKSDWLVTPSARQGKRTPGLFKVEFTGDQMISLCSKSYCISEKEQYEAESSRRFKFSMKGINKSQFKNNPYEHYANVLNTTNTFRANNAGIRSHNGAMYTYKQRKNALTYFYPKRIVLDDGRSTKPLLL